LKKTKELKREKFYSSYASICKCFSIILELDHKGYLVEIRGIRINWFFGKNHCFELMIWKEWIVSGKMRRSIVELSHRFPSWRSLENKLKRESREWGALGMETGTMSKESYISDQDWWRTDSEIASIGHGAFGERIIYECLTANRFFFNSRLIEGKY
jgi:hypothetical protein